mgnify:FL=1
MSMQFIGQLDLAKSYGVRVKYQGNILCCVSYRTAEENLSAIKKALCILIDMDADILFGVADVGGPCMFEADGGVIELYRTRG